MKDAPPPAACVAGGLALGATAALAYWQHYNDNVAAPPRIWLADGPLREKVLPHCNALLRPFAPTPWAANRHAQTLLGFMRTLTIRSRYNRQLILTVDGATLGLDWFGGCDAPDFPLPASAPVLLVCHGINGGSHEGYAKWVCAAALARGWRAAVLNYRGCNGLPFTAPRGYSATMSPDIFTAVYSLKARYPSAPLLAVGYSLGGLKLTKYVGEADAGLHAPPPGQPHLFSGSGLAAAAVVSSPVSLGLSAAKLSDPTSISFLYNLAVAYKVREHIALHRRDIEAHTRLDVDAVLAAWTVMGIEDRGLPASLGFADRQQYYDAASSLEYIPAITTPTLMLLAEDDPFLGIVPDVECSRNPSTLLALTRRGGHVAFLQGAWPLGRSYMDDAVMEFFGATLEHMHGYKLPAPLTPAGGGHAAPLPAAPADSPRTPAGAATAAAAGASVNPMITDAARAGALAAAAAAAGRSCRSLAGCCGGPGLRGAREVGTMSTMQHHDHHHHHHHDHHHQTARLESSGGARQAEQQPGGGRTVAAATATATAVQICGGGGRARDDVSESSRLQSGQLLLLMQLQQQLEQRQQAAAAAAAAPAAANGSSGGGNAVLPSPALLPPPRSKL